MTTICVSEVDSAVSRRPVSSLRANFKWTFASNIVYAACQWGMLSVLAKAGTAGMVGQFALGLAIAAPVFMFANLQLRAVQATDARGEYRFSDYFTLRILSTALGLLAIAGILPFLPCDSATRIVILLVALAKSIECISDVIGGLLQLHEHLDQVARSLMFRGSLSLLLFGATFLWTHSLIACTTAMCIAWLTILIGYDFRRAKAALLPGEPYLRFDWQVARRLIVLSLPLGLVMTLISLNTNIPRYLLQRFFGTAELGIFASLAYLMVALNLVVNALCQSATTRLSGLFSEQKFDDYCHLLFRLSIFGVAVALAGVPLSLLCGRTLLTILYRPQYGDYATVLAILVAASGISATAFFLTSGLNAARCFRAQLPIFAASTLTTILGCLILVPKRGLNGAAMALLLSAAVGLAGNLLVLNATLSSARAGAEVSHGSY
jgi:O-antigen/teichoic acid export membrane protein